MAQPAPIRIAEALLVNGGQAEGERLQGRNGRVDSVRELRRAGTGQQAFDPLRRSRARHAVNHVAERDGLSENKPPAEEGFRLRAIAERINVGAKLERLAAGHAHEVLAYLEDPLDDSHRENEVPAEADRADIDCRAELVGRIHAEVVIPETHTRLADPAGVDHPGIAERDGKIIDVRVASSAAGRERPEIDVVALLPAPVSPEEHIVAIPQCVVDTRNDLLALLPEWEGAAVLLEQGHHVRSMSRHQRISELIDEWRKGRRRDAERVDQRLL